MTTTFSSPSTEQVKEQAEQLAGTVAGVVRDAAYVVIGLGVLTVQQAQVRRRELIDTLSDNPVVHRLGATRAQIQELVDNLERRLSKIDDGVEGRIDSVVDAAVRRLPEQAAGLITQAHNARKTARKQVRGLFCNAA